MPSMGQGQQLRSSIFFLLLLLIPRPTQACSCDASLSACNAVGTNSLVFIGAVESIEPNALSRWNLTNRSTLRSLADAFADARQNPSAADLARLKSMFREVFPGAAADEKRQLEAARSLPALVSLYNSI